MEPRRSETGREHPAAALDPPRPDRGRPRYRGRGRPGGGVRRRSPEEFDTIVWCTGYDVVIPFLDHGAASVAGRRAAADGGVRAPEGGPGRLSTSSAWRAARAAAAGRPRQAALVARMIRDQGAARRPAGGDVHEPRSGGAPDRDHPLRLAGPDRPGRSVIGRLEAGDARPDRFRKLVGRRCGAARPDVGITVGDLAEGLRPHVRAAHRLEAGEQAPVLGGVPRGAGAEAADVSCDYLLGRAAVPRPWDALPEDRDSRGPDPRRDPPLRTPTGTRRTGRRRRRGSRRS